MRWRELNRAKRAAHSSICGKMYSGTAEDREVPCSKETTPATEMEEEMEEEREARLQQVRINQRERLHSETADEREGGPQNNQLQTHCLINHLFDLSEIR